MSNPWFRFYTEFATDPKVQTLSEVMQRRLVMLFCLEGSEDLEKLNEEEIAFSLRIDIETLHETFQLFQKKGFLDEDNRIRNWSKRQFKSDSSTDRVKKYRAKTKTKDNETTVKRFRNDSETPPDTDTDTDTEEEEETTSAKKNSFQGKTINLTEKNYQEFKTACPTYDDEKFKQALSDADFAFTQSSDKKWFWKLRRVLEIHHDKHGNKKHKPALNEKQLAELLE
jgi:hypothetical protein